ncbi:MAG: ComEC/Rec2 family competence protein [Bacteroidota bacterium]|nr:ComEC/Rec2 family competence protein [Candidatus Kapabacteria bacterium]MDW8074440.1 ComEC/Rec2 family competence protein [Bacteroidota bacterium]
MTAQNYGIITNTREPAIPRRLTTLLGLSTLGGIVEWYAQVSIDELIIPSCAALMLCMLSIRIVKLRSLAYSIACLGIGVLTCSRITADLPIVSKHTLQILAWIDGKIIDIVSISPTATRCIVEATVDPQWLPPRSGIRLLLYLKNFTADKEQLRGKRIIATSMLRPVHTPEYPNGTVEWLRALSHHIHLVGYTVGNPPAFLSSPPSSIDAAFDALRAFTRSTCKHIFSDQATRTLVEAIILGQRQNLEHDLREKFSRTGTAHLLAVSGFHVGVIASIIFLLTTPLGNRGIRYVLLCIAVWIYVLFTGASPPALRAGIAITLAASLMLAQRWIHPLQAVFIALWLMLIVEPRLVFSLSFQLSAAAVIGITTIGAQITRLPLWRTTQSSVVSFLRSSGSITLGASIATAPITAWAFGYIPLLSLPANLVVVPVATVFIITSSISLGAGMLSISLGRFYASVAEATCRGMLWVVELFASLDWVISGVELPILAALSAVALWYTLNATSLRHGLFRGSISILILATVGYAAWRYASLPQTQTFKDIGIAATVQRLDRSTFFVSFDVHAGSEVAPSFVRAVARHCSMQGGQRIYLRCKGKMCRALTETFIHASGKVSKTVVLPP